jgi:hypothetical protein
LMVFLSGLIWDRIGPHYVFLTYVSLDLVLRAPLLVSMPETLSLKLKRQISEMKE